MDRVDAEARLRALQETLREANDDALALTAQTRELLARTHALLQTRRRHNAGYGLSDEIRPSRHPNEPGRHGPEP